MDTAIDLDIAIDHILIDPAKILDLTNIRYQLVRLEDTIIFHLIERVQFPLNSAIYDPEAVSVPCSNLALPAKLSLADYILSETERLHSLVRRYDAPDEFPFFPQVLARPLLQPIQYPKILHANNVNVNAMIKERYTKEILPLACRKFNREDRGEARENYGSAATCDVACLQALSRRIHFGKFVAESKFLKNPDRFINLIKAGDRDGIEQAITNKAVEQQVLERLQLKAKTYGVDPSALHSGVRTEEIGKIDNEAVVTMYKHVVIPLTKKVEVDYLMQRLEGTEWE